MKTGYDGYVPDEAVKLLRPADQYAQIGGDTVVLSEANRFGRRLSEVHKDHYVHVVAVAPGYLKIRMASRLEGFIAEGAVVHAGSDTDPDAPDADFAASNPSPAATAPASGEPEPSTGASVFRVNIITVNSTPDDANVVVKTQSGEVLGRGVTPFRVHVHCYDTAVITVSAPGFDSQTVEDPPPSNEDKLKAFGAALVGLGGLVGNDGAKCHSKDTITVNLTRSETDDGRHN